MKSRKTSINLLSELLEIPYIDRIKVIEKDLVSGLDRYKHIDPKELALALEVPLTSVDGTKPEMYNLWEYYHYVEITPIALLLEEYDPCYLLEFIEDQLSIERHKKLDQLLSLKKVDIKSIIDQLTVDECIIISQKEAKQKLFNEDGDYYETTAFYNISNTDFNFQAMLDGDYLALSELKTPYDERDGKFLECRDEKRFVFEQMF
jgi:hypothetical protein